MSQLRNLVALLFAALALYTVFAVASEGLNFLPVFVGDLVALSWRGQINLDLLCFTSLAGLWVAWRHQFSAGGIAMGLLVLVGAMLVFAPYLLFVISRSEQDMAALFFGKNR